MTLCCSRSILVLIQIGTVCFLQELCPVQSSLQHWIPVKNYSKLAPSHLELSSPLVTRPIPPPCRARRKMVNVARGVQRAANPYPVACGAVGAGHTLK
jgi:hypothetical protein